LTFDVVTLGEAMLRLSVPPGDRLEDADGLDLHVAGAEANTAIALAQLGRHVTWLSRLPDSPLGRRVGRELRAAGVDTSYVRWVPEARMGVYFVELASPPRPVSVVYDRAGSAAAELSPDDLPSGLVDSAKVVHLSGITPALSDGCRRLALEMAERARAATCRLTVDINYRSKLWSPESANVCLTALAVGADLVVLTREDARDVFEFSGEPAAVAAEARKRLGVRTVVLTLGEQGSMWDSESGSGKVDALPTEIVDRLGAGDAFMAGVIDGLLDNDLERGLRTGSALASLALGSHGDHVITNRAEVDRLLEGGGRVVDR
jgi:2-dehydro-3-deoxygluconokinase